MNYKCGNCGEDLARLADDCPTCMKREAEKKKKIQEEYDAKNKNPQA